LIAIEHEPVALDEVLQLPFKPGVVSRFCPGAVGGLIGVLSYDDLERVAYSNGNQVRSAFMCGDLENPPQSASPSFVRRVQIAVEAPADRSRVSLKFSSGRRKDAFNRLDEYLAAAARSARLLDFSRAIQSVPALSPELPDSAYLDKVRRVLCAVRDGRWYQLNLLRFFHLEFDAGSSRVPFNRTCPLPGWFAWRLDTAGGEWSALIDAPVGRIVSFSPERFCSVRPDVNGAFLRTFPVKGTMARSLDPVQDRESARKLSESRKDLAELHMIVDLMRNDFHRIAVANSVKVPVEQMVRPHANVHHLHAEVTAMIGNDTSLADLVGAICPAGSITGTPKLEVMQGIREMEVRRRGYHMGNVFHWRPDGQFDSSVLIRTVTASSKQPGGFSAQTRNLAGTYELAAGSGIVVHSDPDSELAEVMAKARIVSAPLMHLSG
jgi:anthranilate/para-aminobenzoate synthase component I